MKVLTVHQPWAELIACGAKRIETRAWNTWYRGPLVIHASKEQKSCMEMNTRIVLSKTLPSDEAIAKCSNMRGIYEENFGAIIAVCNLVGVVGPIEETIEPVQYIYVTEFNKELQKKNLVSIPPQEPELSFGDYTPGRYAWILEDVKRLAVPIPAKGKQKLWDFDIPEEVLTHE